MMEHRTGRWIVTACYPEDKRVHVSTSNDWATANALAGMYMKHNKECYQCELEPEYLPLEEEE